MLRKKSIGPAEYLHLCTPKVNGYSSIPVTPQDIWQQGHQPSIIADQRLFHGIRRKRLPADDLVPLQSFVGQWGVTLGGNCFTGHSFQPSACHIRVAYCHWGQESLGAQGMPGRWRPVGRAIASLLALMYAADVAFVTTLLLPHLPSNVKRLLESTAFKA